MLKMEDAPEELPEDVKQEILQCSEFLDNSGDDEEFQEEVKATINPGFKLLIDEEHFKKSVGTNDTEEAKVEEIKAEEGKGAEDEIESKEFDEVMNSDDYGMQPRPERVSNIVQEVTTDDFEMIRFLGDGSYGKVNLVK